MKRFILLLVFTSISAFAQTKTCDFRLQSCIREGEMISTTWAGSTPNTCYTRSGDSFVPDPCSGRPKHVEPSAAYLKGLPLCCREFPQPQGLPYNTVDCDNANGNPKLCTVEADEETWKPEPMGADGQSRTVIRHITQTSGRPYHQRCTNGGIEAELTADGFLRCEDAFTNKKTGAECKVNPDSQRGFVCKQKK